MYLHGKGHLIILQHEFWSLSFGSDVTTSFESHEWILLEYPYRTNCRDYTKSGLLSIKHCNSISFKAKTVKRYKSTILETHAVASDNVPLKGFQGITNPTTLRFFEQQCEKECLQRDCQYMTYLINTKHYEYSSLTKTKLESRCFRGSHTNYLLYDSEPLNDSAHITRVDEKVVTRTETQLGIPLVSFLKTFDILVGFLCFRVGYIC